FISTKTHASLRASALFTDDHLDKPAALFRYSPDRKDERPREHLKTFAGFLQADAYAGFERLYASDRQPAPITPVACWAHARRKLNDVYKADPNSAAIEGLQLIGELYDVEQQIVREPADFRRKARKLSKLKALDFFAWADDVVSRASARSPLAEALRYAVKLKPQLLTYTDDGRLEIDNNPAENALRGIAISQTFCPCRARRRHLVPVAPIFRAHGAVRVYGGSGDREGRSHCRASGRSHRHPCMDVGPQGLRGIQLG
ncbi:IS66 family transposase, partial [Novosphingobium resinovorum]